MCGDGWGHAAKEIGKAPLPKGGHLAATTDEKEIREWWEKWTDANVSLALWPSALVAVDQDSDEAEQDARARGLPPTVNRVSHRPAQVYRRPEGWPIERALRVGPSGALDVLSGGYLLAHGRHRYGHLIYLE
jgi:hypothetical protein